MDPITACLQAYAAGERPDRATEKSAVKESLAALAAKAPGHSVEVRIPPYAAVQVVDGVRHRRGTPPALVETDATTWLRLAAGVISWADATASGTLRASGERSDLSAYLPIDLPIDLPLG